MTYMKFVSRRVAVGALCTAVVAAMAGVTTWAVAQEPARGPVRLVVGLKNKADKAAPMRTLSAAGLRAMDTTGPASENLSFLGAQTLEVSADSQARVMEELKQDPNVAYVEVDHVRKAFDITPNDPMYLTTEEFGGQLVGLQSEVDRVRLPAAWETTTGSSAVKIAVLDTGVTKTGDLTNAVIGGRNLVGRNTNTTDDAGHGTIVASLIAARGNNGTGMAGACWSCVIIPVKVLDKYGMGNDSTVAEGIVYAVEAGAKIINMSLGSPESSRVLADAVAHANSRGVLVVAAAGNDGESVRWRNVKQYPAAYPDVVAVGAAARNSDERADFSSFNKPGDSWVDIAAPGDVLGMDQYGLYDTEKQGTSFAAPMVAGVAGLIKSAHPRYTGWSLQRALLNSARPIGGDGWVKRGMVDAAKALTIDTDTQSPVITGVPAPAQNARVRGKITIKTTGVADVGSGVLRVALYVDGKYKAEDRTAPYELPYDTAGRNGRVALQVRVIDKAGNAAKFDRSIIADNLGPKVKITSGPANKARVSGTVKLAATASDAGAVRRVELLINGKVRQKDTAAPYKFTFKASSYRSGMKVQIRAIDVLGNVTTTKTRTYKR
ncbi:S8 family serine peptidase [Actinoplanes sp. NPDC051346]|uniref:S8 family serine peptidase n=1 Tax=Actinoplanes sp. NPDC051346 TaxID=3155048 RepID=UPI003414947D